MVTRAESTDERDETRREIERLRARIIINASDVAQANVTAASRIAWLRERCEPSTGPTRGTTIWSSDGVKVVLTWDDAIDDGVQRGETARFINNVAPLFGLTPWALLEQLAAVGQAITEEDVDIEHVRAFMRRAGRDVSVSNDTLREELRDDPMLSDDERQAYLDKALDAEWGLEPK